MESLDLSLALFMENVRIKTIIALPIPREQNELVEETIGNSPWDHCFAGHPAFNQALVISFGILRLIIGIICEKL